MVTYYVERIIVLKTTEIFFLAQTYLPKTGFKFFAM